MKIVKGNWSANMVIDCHSMVIQWPLVVFAVMHQPLVDFLMRMENRLHFWVKPRNPERETYKKTLKLIKKKKGKLPSGSPPKIPTLQLPGVQYTKFLDTDRKRVTFFW